MSSINQLKITTPSVDLSVITDASIVPSPDMSSLAKKESVVIDDKPENPSIQPKKVIHAKSLRQSSLGYNDIERTKRLTQDQIVTMSGDPSKGVSICIPRVFNNISWYRIKQAFIALNWGFIERVDVIPSGGTKRAFVHFAPGRFTATKILEALINGEQIKIIYEDPWFWQISLSRSAKPESAPERVVRPVVQFHNKRDKYGRKYTIDIEE